MLTCVNVILDGQFPTREVSKVVNKKHHSSSLSVFYQRFVVSRRIHVWMIYLHMFNCHGKEISYMDRVAIDMWFLFQSTSHVPIGIQAMSFAKCLA